MTRYSDRPYHNDVIKGGNMPPPVKDAALGGLEGIKRRLQVASSEDKKISVLRDVLRYGQAGKDLLKQIIKSESGAVQVAAYCLLNFDSQATEVESQEILGVINAAVQRSIDTRIEVRQVSMPAVQSDASDIDKSSSPELPDLATKMAQLPQIAHATASKPHKSRAEEVINQSNQNLELSKKERQQSPQQAVPSSTKAPVNKSTSDRAPKLPPIQPRPQTQISSQPGYAAPQNGKARPPHKHRRDGKKNQNGLQKWFNQTLGISDQPNE